MADFLNACIFCFGVAVIVAAIVGHEDALALAILAIFAVVLRLAVWAIRRARGKT